MAYYSKNEQIKLEFMQFWKKKILWFLGLSEEKIKKNNEMSMTKQYSESCLIFKGNWSKQDKAPAWVNMKYAKCCLLLRKVPTSVRLNAWHNLYDNVASCLLFIYSVLVTNVLKVFITSIVLSLVGRFITSNIWLLYLQTR